MSQSLSNQASWTTGSSEFTAREFHIRQILAEINTAELVEVTAVTPGQGLLPGTVDVLPLVDQIDGNGNVTPHGIVHGLIYFRYQCGTNAIIMDPAIGDIGVAIYCSRDISAVKATNAQAAPGSYRKFAKPDGIFFGGVLSMLAPTQFMQFAQAGINIISPGTVTVQAPHIATQGALVHTGTVMVNGHILDERHIHTNVQPGSGDTGPVQ